MFKDSVDMKRNRRDIVLISTWSSMQSKICRNINVVSEKNMMKSSFYSDFIKPWQSENEPVDVGCTSVRAKTLSDEMIARQFLKMSWSSKNDKLACYELSLRNLYLV